MLETIGAPPKPCLRQLPLPRLPPDLPQIRSAQLLRRLIDGLGAAEVSCATLALYSHGIVRRIMPLI
jgi:hypothetical protein